MKRCWLKYFLSVWLCGILIPVWIGFDAGQARAAAPLIRKGILDLRGWDIQNNGPIALAGEWRFFWHRFIPPGSLENDEPDGAPIYFNIPNGWKGMAAEGKKLPGTGFASFRFTLFADNTPKAMALYIPESNTAYELFVNGKMVSANGTVGTSKDTSRPWFQPHVIRLEKAPQMNFLLHISNFHDHKGGPRKKIYFGTEYQIRRMYHFKFALDLFLLGSFTMIGLYYLGIYILFNQARSAMMFTIFCFVIAVRILVSGQYFIVHLFPSIPWELIMKGMGITFFIGVPAFLWFVQSVFPHFIPPKAVTGITVVGLLLTTISLVTSRIIYSQFMLFFQIVTCITAILIFYALYYEIQQKTEGSRIFVFGFSLFFLTVINDILVDNEVIHTPSLVAVGLFLFIFSQAFLLSKRLSNAYKIIDRQRSELSDKNQKLQQAIRQVEAANQVQTQFMNNISHELRTPLNGVIGFTEMITETDLDTSQLEFIRLIRANSEDLLGIINDILDFQKLGTSNAVPQALDFDLELLIYDLCESYQLKIEPRPIEILCKIDEDLPVLVKGDPNQFRKVLGNLLSNAAKFTQSGEIEVDLEILPHSGQNLFLQTTVRDTGVGIPESRIQDIFEPFVQVDGSSTRKYGGTGLGLSLCRKIVQQMGGDIWAESREGNGSLFSFTARFEKTETKPTPRYHPTALKGKTVLIYDINPTAKEGLSMILKSSGVTVIETMDSQSFLNAIDRLLQAANPPDACIFNIKRSAPDSLKVVEQLHEVKEKWRRQTNNTVKIPLLAIAASLSAVESFQHGFNGFINKPIRKDRLLLVLDKLIRSTKQPSSSTDVVNQYSVREELKRSLKILLVEDNKMNQKVAGAMIKKAGYQVETADNGKEAVELVNRKPHDFDLILMDIQMPEMDGISATKALRENGCTEIPIVALTAHAREEDRRACLDAGMNDHITKPLKREKLYTTLRTWVIDRSKDQG